MTTRSHNVPTTKAPQTATTETPTTETTETQLKPPSRPTASPAAEPERPMDLSDSSWRGVLKRALKEFGNDNLSDWAAALTYRAVLALAPGLLLVVSSLGLLGPNTTNTLLNNIGTLAPGGVKSVLTVIVHNAQSRSAAGSAAVIGLVLALWSASGYIAAFMRASNAIYEIGEGRPVWKTVPIRLAVTLAMVVMIVISAVIVVFTGPLADKVGQAIGVGHTAVLVWSIAKWPVLVVIVALMLAILYYAAPNARQPGFQWISPGGLLAVLIWVVASAAFAIYVANFGSYNKTYGTLAGVVVFLIWLWITNIALLLGVEFNAEVQHARAIQGGQPEDQIPFVEPRDTTKLDDEAQERATALDKP